MQPFEELENAIVFEDEAMIVLSKPAGWVVNRAQTYPDLTIQDWMDRRLGRHARKSKNAYSDEKENAEEGDDFAYGTPEEIFEKRGGVVHRLDKDTSGILLLAKTPPALFDLLRQFKEREVEKTYIALVHGKLSPPEGTIRLPMDRSSRNRKKFSVSADGRVAETQYTVQEFFPGLPAGIDGKKGKSYQGFSLVDLYPRTGRTHQIRVHMAAIKHPLVGDDTYVGSKRIRTDRQWCPRQFLHASAISFQHPVTKETMKFTAKLPGDLTKVLARLRVE